MKSNTQPRTGKRRLLIMIPLAVGAVAAVLAILFFVMRGGGETPVASRIAEEDITEFYYTYDASVNPPDYQRYRLYTEGGKRLFYHEQREGDHWPLTEADITVSGTKELTAEEWTAFYDCLKDGTVRRRSEHTDSGNAGPWLYIYLKGRSADGLEFAFSSYDKQAAFEALCRDMKDASR